MKNLQKILLITIGSLSLSAFISAKAQIIITEVDATGSSEAGGSSSTTYAADWFELTNEGTTAQNISGWKIDDDSDSFSKAVTLNGVTSVAAGQSVVFIESTGTTAAAVEAKFEAAWFGSNVPKGFTIGDYSGSGVGLGSGGDQVNIFDASGDHITGVDFLGSTAGVSFDNSVAKVGDNSTISTLSVAGVHGAFTSPVGEVGSPGAVPEPSTYALILGGFIALAGFFRRNKQA